MRNTVSLYVGLGGHGAWLKGNQHLSAEGLHLNEWLWPAIWMKVRNEV
jgi:hypothetical protein